ncbi:unnamed protein product [Tuber melanosporum]|uniref:(Perigord truffle) hypothetical protein n=1 Tax=Tuber melanosporum (strain Mel28) TaxID=656061 RepID=D5GKQ1_TUBMM|nr:uncharacterized protein GSTUM_00009698001 [Tuber melanosporum]CAZ85094.1 unnamed protein product [Tuber melanosporum]
MSPLSAPEIQMAEEEGLTGCLTLPWWLSASLHAYEISAIDTSSLSTSVPSAGRGRTEFPASCRSRR